MQRREIKAYLLEIVQACDAIARFCSGKDLLKYQQDDLLRSAIERQLFIVGEAVNQIRHIEPVEVHTLGDVQGIVTVRNILAHVYFGVRHEVVWDIATKDAPKLRTAAQQWLDTLG